MTNENARAERYLRLKDVLNLIPVSRSTWYRGVKAGIYPKPFKISTRASAWRSSEIDRLMKELAAGFGGWSSPSHGES